ncbi:Uma2 family endonuclease [Marinoscillum pacificum]|uniref:Uma2 family endonuclease n=1 Tax=Marinoscillum pacificum TaxID=392723 RepID=UPI0021587C55|nr:Uma2 family endonuclease [Marinoscillum pacificum]
MAIAIDYSQKYSYADYLSWSDDERWEIISGYPYNMSPAPSRRHQKALGILFRRLGDFLDSKPSDVYMEPFDVRLSEDYSDEHLVDNVVQPDLSVFL